MVNKSKEWIIKELRRLEVAHGNVGRERFERLAEITITEWRRATDCVNWSEVRELAGLEANDFQKQLDWNLASTWYCRWIIEHKKVPTNARMALLSPKYDEVISLAAFRRKFGSESDDLSGWKLKWISSLLAFAEREVELAEALPILMDWIDKYTPAEHSKKRQKSNEADSSAYSVVSDSYVPPVIACLTDLAKGNSRLLEHLKANNIDPDKDFERRVGIALHFLGAEVEPMGRIGKSEPDGIARWRAQGWALIYDAKRWENGFKLNTSESRKFLDYAVKYGQKLREEGFNNVYFAAISGSFVGNNDITAAHEIVRQTGAHIKSVALIETNALLTLIENRFRSGEFKGKFDSVERVFAQTRIVKSVDVE